MTAAWKLAAESRLLRGDTPAVLTSGMLQMIAALPGQSAPPRATFQRWVDDLLTAQKLRRVIKGVSLPSTPKPFIKSSPEIRQPAETAGKTPNLFSEPSTEEPSLRTVADNKYLSL